MKTMLRNTGGFLAGLFVAGLLIAVIEFLGFQMIKDPPPGLSSQDPAVQQAAIAQLPTIAFVMLLVAYGAGSFGGALVTAVISQHYRLLTAGLLGLLLWCAAFFWLLQIPSPPLAWASLAVIPLATLAGAIMAFAVRSDPPDSVQPYDMRKKGMACK